MKRFITKCMAVIMASSVCLTAFPSAVFASNTPSSWAAGTVNSAIAYGLVPEEVQGRYQDNITREEFAILLDELCNDYSGGKGSFIFWKNYNWDEYDSDGHPFTDTQNFAVKRMYSAGIMSGIGNGKFGPNELLTREQAATMINNLFDFCSKSLPASAPTFADSGSISSWAKDAVGKVQAAGIMSGVGYNQFAPKDNYTREQSIVTAFRAYEVLLGKTPSNNTSSGSSSSSTTPSTSGQDFSATFNQLYDSLKYNNDLIEIANATESDPPSTDNFPEIDSSLKNMYPNQSLAIGYLEAAHNEMVKSVACFIKIEIEYVNGYAPHVREEIDEHVQNAYNYLEKAKAAVK
jgi:hypothetical protein